MATIFIYGIAIVAFILLFFFSPCEGNLIPSLLQPALITKPGGDFKISQAHQSQKHVLGDLTLLFDDENRQLLIIERHLVFAINYSDLRGLRMNTTVYFKHVVPSVIYFDLVTEQIPSFGIQLSDKLTLWEMLTSYEKRHQLWTVYNAINALLRDDWEDNKLESAVYIR